MTKSKHVSIGAIAEECGVSSMTVSRALRGSDAVCEKTRDRIIKVAEKRGYIRNARLGRPIIKNQREAPSVDVVNGLTPSGNLPFFHSQLLACIEQQLSQYGYDCVIRTCGKTYEQFLKVLEATRASKSKATLLIGDFPSDCLKTLFEAVPDALLLDNPGDASIGQPYETFCFDNTEAGRIAVEHIVSCGRSKIALVTGAAKHFFSREFERGYREALAANDVEIDENLIIRTNFTVQDAEKKMNEALDKRLDFDAVLTNDEMASGVYRSLFERGLKIPKDISVCGCDGLPIGEHLYPRLTTVKLDYEELGKKAVNHLLNDRTFPSSGFRMRLLPKLEIRESTRIISK